MKNTVKRVRLPLVPMTRAKLRGAPQVSGLIPLIDSLLCRNFVDGHNMSCLVESHLFREATNLKTIEFDVNGAKITPGLLNVLFANLHRLPRLTTLDLENATADCAGWESIAQNCVWSPSITELRLPRLNYNGIFLAEPVASLLAKATSLTSLSIRLQGDQPSMYRPVFQSITALAKLKHLILGVTNNTEAHCVHSDDLATMLRSTPSLCSISIHLGHKSYQDMSSLFFALRDHPTITSIRMNSALPRSIDSLAQILSRHPRITSLNFEHFNLSDEAFFTLMSALKGNEALRFLDLSVRLGISSASFQELADSVAKLRNLRTLILQNITDGDTAALLPVIVALTKHPSIANIDISANNLNSDCISQLGMLLETTKSLTALKFSCADDIPRHFFESLAKNDTLSDLNLFTCLIRQAAGEAIGEMLAQNRMLGRLELEQSRISPEGYNGILLGLTKNRTLIHYRQRMTYFVEETPGSGRAFLPGPDGKIEAMVRIN
jgi:Ran GTPase-activating protein (RanGAP) involved in mRNA processing and transport